ncbi:MAG: hypothetical protein AB1449_00835 [Chloroflexota bacterium]
MNKVVSSSATGRLQVRKFQVGDLVDVLCDHMRDGDRVRDWLQGVVVQADEKMVAVQFLTDVYLTDGWMVPDRVLWCRQGSGTARPSTRRRITRGGSRRN